MFFRNRLEKLIKDWYINLKPYTALYSLCVWRVDGLLKKKNSITWKCRFCREELVLDRRTPEAIFARRFKPAAVTVAIVTKIVEAIFHKATTFHKTVAAAAVIVEIRRRRQTAKRLFRLFHWFHDGKDGLAEAGNRLGRREIPHRRRWRRQLGALRVAGLDPTAVVAMKIVVVVNVDKG